MFKALSFSAAASMIFASQLSFANMSVSNAEVLRAASGPQGVSCSVDVLDQEDHEIAVFKGDLNIQQNGAVLETAVGVYSVLIEGYVSGTNEDGSQNRRIEVQINGPSQQEDYINSSLKPITFLSALKGELKNEAGETTAFNNILVDCNPNN